MSNIERESKELKSTSGKTVIVKSYLTAREMETINLSLVGDSKTDGSDGAKVSISIAAGIDWEKKILAAAIVSVDGNTTNPADSLLDWPDAEYKELKAQVLTTLGLSLKPTK